MQWFHVKKIEEWQWWGSLQWPWESTRVSGGQWGVNQKIVAYLVGGLVAMVYFPMNIGCCHHPNWRTHIFQRGGYTTTNQIQPEDIRMFFEDVNGKHRWFRMVIGSYNKYISSLWQQTWSLWQPPVSSKRWLFLCPELDGGAASPLVRERELEHHHRKSWVNHMVNHGKPTL